MTTSWLIDDADGFEVPRLSLRHRHVRRLLLRSSGVPRLDTDHSPHGLERTLHAPEASAGKDGDSLALFDGIRELRGRRRLATGAGRERDGEQYPHFAPLRL